MTTRDEIVPEIPDVLIAPMDGSRAADRAVPVICEVASNLGVPVRVVHVLDSIRQLRSCAVGDIEWSEDAEPRAVIHPPAGISEAVSTITDARIQVEVVGRIGVADQEILRELSRSPGSWIAMSTLGSGGIRSLFMGSTARAVVRASSRPVLLVPSNLSGDAIAEWRLHQRIAVFLDGSSEAESSIPHAAALAEQSALHLDLVRVAETLIDASPERSVDGNSPEERARAETADYLRRIEESCGDLGITVNMVPLAGSPDVQLIDYVRREAPGVVAIATRKRSGIERWTYGSLAERLVDALSVPLLLVPVRGD